MTPTNRLEDFIKDVVNGEYDTEESFRKALNKQIIEARIDELNNWLEYLTSQRISVGDENMMQERLNELRTTK